MDTNMRNSFYIFRKKEEKKEKKKKRKTQQFSPWGWSALEQVAKKRGCGVSTFGGIQDLTGKAKWIWLDFKEEVELDILWMVLTIQVFLRFLESKYGITFYNIKITFLNHPYEILQS